MERSFSTPVHWVGTEHLGFVVNASFSKENSEKLVSWLTGLQEVASDGIYTMDASGLHITVLDWVAPLFDYGGADKRKLYEMLYPSYDQAFRRITDTMEPFSINFTETRVTPGAIILVGQDDGQFQSLRNQFMSATTLPEGGKQPPNIVHSSLARFVAPEIELTAIETYATEHPLNLKQQITEFRLVETRREPMQDFSVLDTYELAG